MDPFYQRAAIARAIREASDALLEASERSSDLKRFELSTELLDESVKLHELAREILELPRQPAAAEQRQDLPF